jgi:rhodanese-related sulfurtransferase
MSGERGGRAGGPKGYREYIAEAERVVTTCSAADAVSRLGDPDTVFVDVRDGIELETSGRVPGAVHASRGALEFYVDPESPYFMEAFGEDRTFLFFCAVGGRSPMAAQRAMEMGLDRVEHVEGGLEAWRAAGGPVEEPSPTM